MKSGYSLFKAAWQMNYAKPVFLNSAFQRGLKFQVDVKWVKPQRKPVYFPENSGDLETFNGVSKDTLRLEYQNSEELKSANDLVKKIFSIEYAPDKNVLQVYQQSLIDRVKRNAYDTRSPEVIIAKQTAQIRFHQQQLIAKPINKKLVVKVKELIDKRKGTLTRLRLSDYRRFEWVLEKLNLEYKPRVEFDGLVTRKKSLALLVKLKVEMQKEKKLGNFKQSLDEQKVPFLENKLEKLKWIKEMESKYNLPSSITNEDISQCIEKLEQVKLEVAERAKRGYIRKIHPYTLEPYYENLHVEKNS